MEKKTKSKFVSFKTRYNKSGLRFFDLQIFIITRLLQEGNQYSKKKKPIENNLALVQLLKLFIH